MQSKNYSEIAYLLRQNKVHLDKKVKIDVEKKYAIKCNGVKISSNAKKTTPHKLEIQFDVLCRTHLDKKKKGFIKKMKALK